VSRITAGIAIAAFSIVCLWPQFSSACRTPDPPISPPTVTTPPAKVIIQGGVIFATTTPHSCACSIGVTGPTAGLDFGTTDVGVLNTLTNVFTSVFSLVRNPLADSAWAAGMGADGSTPVPGATWFGFSNLNVPPVTPPTLGPNEVFAACFNIVSGSVGPGNFFQEGGGVGLQDGLPDFGDNNGHGSRYSGLSVPEPASVIGMAFGLVGLTYWLRSRPRKSGV
jgi:hypothetical protein